MSHDFGTPEAVAIIGGREIRPVSVSTYASREWPIARAELELSPDDVNWLSIQDAKIRLELGVDGQFWLVHAGSITSIIPANPVRAVSLDAVHSLKLMQCSVAIVRPTLRDVLDTVFSQVGISEWSVAPSDAQTRLFLARSISGTDVIQACRTSFGVVDWDFYVTPEGRFYFGPWATSDRAAAAPVVTLQHNVNIDDLVLDARGGRVSMDLSPWVRHGHRVIIEDPDVSGAKITVRVERVIHRFNAVDGGKTELQWTPV